MGHKVHPFGYRLGITENWLSRWIVPKKELGDLVIEDYKIRQYINSKIDQTIISKIEIERKEKTKATVIIHTIEPGTIIGKGGKKASDLEEELSNLTGKDIKIEIVEIQNAYLDAQIVAGMIARELVKRRPHRRVMHKYADAVMQAGAKGVKIQVKGRIGGIEIARKEWLIQGKVPLITIRSIIDYGQITAHLKKGTVGVKVWIYKGEKFDLELK